MLTPSSLLMDASVKLGEILSMGPTPSKKAALVKDGKVINCINLPVDWTGKEGEWQAPVGVLLVFDEDASPDDASDGVNVDKSKRAPKPHVPSAAELDRQAKVKSVMASPNVPQEVKDLLKLLADG